ncbi:MAG: hypothetical protein M3R38_20545 [Actinomycetota bacterium]|nr:hypothetical protein [Actinomycetota bacterium]
MPYFEIIGTVRNVEAIAAGRAVRDRRRLNRDHGKARWRKLKGTASVRLEDGTTHLAEVHWYEAHGIGRVECKVKHLLD